VCFYFRFMEMLECGGYLGETIDCEERNKNKGIL
jgi:hypothetical protein